MLLVSFVNIIAVLLAYLSRYKQTRYAFDMSILLLIVFYGIRYDSLCTDWPNYVIIFNDVNGYPDLVSALIGGGSSWGGEEPGWIVLNRLFHPFGFCFLIFCLTAFQFCVVRWFIRKYVDRRYYFLALFLFLFSNVFLEGLSALRQTLAMNIVLLSVPFIWSGKKRTWLLSFVIILLAAQFHSSAYIMMVLPVSKYIMLVSDKVYAIIVIALFVLFNVIDVSGIVEYMLSLSVFSDYEGYSYLIDESFIRKGIAYFGTVVCFISILLYKSNGCDDRLRWFVRISSIIYLFYPFMSYLSLIVRVSYYFHYVGFIGLVYWLTANFSSRKPVQIMISCMFIILRLNIFGAVFYDDAWAESFNRYHTVFDSILI